MCDHHHIHCTPYLPFISINIPLLSASSLANHRGIANNTGFNQIREYRYFDPTTRGLNIEGMIQDLKVSPPPLSLSY